MARPLSIAIVGAGMGGLAAAAALRRVGLDVTVYEQAARFIRLGAGIQIGCNAMKVLRGLGLESRLRAQSFYPRSWNNRDWRTGEVKFDMIFGESAEQKFGAPYLLAHRKTPPCFRVASKGVECDGVANAFRRFEASRKGRTARIQKTSRTNTWLRKKQTPTGSMPTTPGPPRWRRRFFPSVIPGRAEREPGIHSHDGE
jgi:2-polyprenyl-6-methoxyphenol hydroxylase-like FAD-dependent oxidoreductase